MLYKISTPVFPFLIQSRNKKNMFDIVTSSAGNNYILDISNGIIQYVHPLLFTREFGGKEYYRQKYNYLKKYGVLKEEQSDYSLSLLSKEDVECNFVGTSQILFEVTDKCNLKCKYCGYGELYNNYDKRENKNLSLDFVKSFWNFYRKKCDDYNNQNHNLTIGFYGGEPLLNFKLIKEIILYIESNSTVRLRYNMTTNAVLLDKYMQFLVDKNFNLLISLDGDQFASSYRVDHKNKPIYDKVIRNINTLKLKYPDYYSRNVSFNAVLHNRNTEDNVFEYFKKEHGKEPFMSPLNPSGVNPLKKSDFDEIQNKNQSVEKFLLKNGRFKRKVLLEYSRFFYNNVFSYYDNYMDLFIGSRKKDIVPTATCSPFMKKIFITVQGKILPCEKIGQEYPLGNISDGVVQIDFEKIANQYNKLYENVYENECKKCSFLFNCSMCLYFFYKGKCSVNRSKNNFFMFMKEKIDFIEHSRAIYSDLDNITFR